mgnify:CR=1 FL=1
MLRLYQWTEGAHREECYYIDYERELCERQLRQLVWLLSGSKVQVSPSGFLQGAIEIGPRLSVETPFSTNAVGICRAMGIPVRRLERSTRYSTRNMSQQHIIDHYLDPMTQQVYDRPIESFDTGVVPEPVRFIPILARGEEAMREANLAYGLGMDEWDIRYYTRLFQELMRDATDAEVLQTGNSNSEHSRHWRFRGLHIVDGVQTPHTLMQLVKAPLRAGSNSLVAFSDNAGVIRGSCVMALVSSDPGKPATLVGRTLIQHITATAETHNHPTFIAPRPGAETGSGGRIRDNRAVGRGGTVHVGVAGYACGNLHIPGYSIPGELIGGERSTRSASPLDILIDGSNGVSDYGNKIGEPQLWKHKYTAEEKEKIECYQMVDGPNHTYKFDSKAFKKHNDRIDNGLKLFGKYFRALWD